MSDAQILAHGGGPPQSADVVNRELTWIAMILAPRAMPEKLDHAPAAIPAT
jgi:hypothetical protein